MQIGELADRLSLNPKTIRYYEEVKLLPAAERSESGYRLFGSEHEKRLRFIKSAQRIGLSLGEIKEILVLRDDGKRPCNYVAGIIDKRLDQVDKQIEDLRKLKKELGDLNKQAKSRTPGSAKPSRYCHIIEQPKSL